MRIANLLPLGPLVLLAGCQMLASTDAARGAAHIGSASVHLEPATPNTLDDLHVVVDAPPAIPKGLSVTYVYAWEVDGAASPVTTDTVPAAATNGGQTWSVTVTPSVNGVMGEPSTASVVVAASTLGTPTVHIEPANPTTVDTLRVVIDTPVVDPDGRAVTYDYAWSVDGTGSVTTSTVGPELTTRGQRWTVSVGARAGDAVGESAGASATIANAAPRIDSLGFDRYRPMLSDDLTAKTLASDPDGDPVTVRYAWRRNTSIPVVGATSEHLDFGSTGFAGNDVVDVVATPNDGFVDGATVALGPIRIYPDAIGWRRVLPNRIASIRGHFAPVTSLSMFQDPDDRRHLLLGQDGLWERADADGTWTQLDPSPSAIDVDLDTTIVAHAEGNEVFVLALDQVIRLSLVRGREAWTVLGTGRSSAFPRTGFYDDTHHRIVVADDSGIGAFDVVSHTWKDLDAKVAVGGAFLHEPGSHIAYLVGGAASDASLSDAVYVLDLDADVLTLLPDVHLPAPRAFAAVAVDAVRRRGFVVGGTSADLVFGTQQWDGGDYTSFEGGVPAGEVYVFDFEHPSFSTLAAPAGSSPRTLGSARWDAEAGRILYEGGMGQDGAWSSDLVAIDPSTGNRTEIDVVGHDAPVPGCAPTSAVGGGITLVGRTDAAGDPVYDRAFAFRGKRFDGIPLAADPTSGYPAQLDDGVRSGSLDFASALAPNADGVTFDTWSVDFTSGGWTRRAVGGLPVTDTGRTIAPRTNPPWVQVLGSSGVYRLASNGSAYVWSSVLTSGPLRPSTWATPFFAYPDGSTFTFLAIEGTTVYTAPWNATASSVWTKPTVTIPVGLGFSGEVAFAVRGAPPRIAVAIDYGPGGTGAAVLSYSAGYAWTRPTLVASDAFETPPTRQCYVAADVGGSVLVYGGLRYPRGYGATPAEPANDVWELVFPP